MKRFLFVAILVFIGATATIEQLAGEAMQGAGYNDEVVDREYCPMWRIWHEEKSRGVAVDRRYGWPDPSGRYFQECGQ